MNRHLTLNTMLPLSLGIKIKTQPNHDIPLKPYILQAVQQRYICIGQPMGFAIIWDIPEAVNYTGRGQYN